MAGGGCSASGHVGSVVRLVAGGAAKNDWCGCRGRNRAVHGGWSGPDVAGTSAMVDLGSASDRAVECLAQDVGGRHDMVDDRPIYELASYEL